MAVSGWVSYDMWTSTSRPATMANCSALRNVSLSSEKDIAQLQSRQKRQKFFVKTSKSTLITSVHVVSTAALTARRLVSTNISLEHTLWSVPRWSLSVLMLLTARQLFLEKLNTPISPPASIKRLHANTVSLGVKRYHFEKISKNTRMMTMHTSVLPWQRYCH